MQREGLLITGLTAAISVLTATQLPAKPVVEAAVGAPFGVARITFPVDPRKDSTPIDTNGYSISEANHRVFYPAFGHRRLLSAFRQLIGVSSPSPRTTVTAFFLFKGEKPFQVTIMTPSRHTFVVIPKRDPNLFEQLQGNWWRQYVAVAELQRAASDYPLLVETYLTSMLGQRLGLPSPVMNQSKKKDSPIPQQSLLLVLNVESMRIKALQRSLRAGPTSELNADHPLPATIDWPAPDMPDLPRQATVEPIARHVPKECFYVRYGNFTNYLWARQLLQRNGGSISRMVTLRGHDARAEERIQEQLGLRESRLASVLGPQVISDVALIGRDTYLHEGAAVGVLFQSRNRELLKAELMKQRSQAVQRFRPLGATIKNIKLNNHTVSIAATPENELRSFYVSIGDFHLVTNTQEIVERFIEVSGNQDSLGHSKAFQLARARHPATADDTVFVYIAPDFFYSLLSPEYQIELRRRLMAVTQLQLVRMASLAARHEGLPHQSVRDLSDSGLLAANFGERPDQSHVEFDGDRLVDSLRGARGTFLPIPDVPIDQVTSEEAAAYEQIKKFHEESWRHIAPILMVVRSTPLQQGREQLQIKAEMVPFEREHYPRASSVIGPPTKTVVNQSRQDAITIQASVQGGAYRPEIRSHQIFFGIQDKDVPVQFASLRALRAMQIMRTAPAYLGTYPTIGFLQALPLGTKPVPDAEGIARLPFGLWQKAEGDEFSIVAFKRSVLVDEMPELSLGEDEHAAQLRIHVEDLTKSRIQSWFAALDFQRAFQASVGNTRLLHMLSQQLGVPPDEALQVAESVLGVNLICALGGRYDRVRHVSGSDYWSSTRWPARVAESESPSAPFVSPIMGWFRGLDARMTLASNRLTGVATIEIQQAIKENPKWNLFDLLK